MSKELQAGYEFTKAQLARLEVLEKQNAVMLHALHQLKDSNEYFSRQCADEAIVKVKGLA